VQLVGFLVVVALITALSLVRAINATGEQRVVYGVFVVLGVVSLLLFLVGWVRRSRRR
jgi:hypothetical protein